MRSSPPSPPAAAPDLGFPSATASSRNTLGRSTCAPLPARALPSAWSFRWRWRGRRSMPNTKGAILVVDDEAEIREGLELLLRSEGYGVASAETGDAGLARLSGAPLRLPFLDDTLPGR